MDLMAVVDVLGAVAPPLLLAFALSRTISLIAKLWKRNATDMPVGDALKVIDEFIDRNPSESRGSAGDRARTAD